MPSPRNRQCPAGPTCKLVCVGDCDKHPICQNGSKCSWLTTRSCRYYHPKHHFKRQYSRRTVRSFSPTIASRHSPRKLRHRSEDRESSRKSSKSRKKKKKKKKKHKKHSHDHNDKTWTQHEHDTLMDLTRQYNTLDDVPIKTLSQIKSTLHKEMNEIKSYFTAQKDNDKSMASWAQWEENYLISFVEQRRILDTFSEPQANEIKHVLNRPMDDIYACVDRLKREEKIKNTEAHAKQSPLFQYLLDNKTETCEETSDPKHSNIPALQLVQSAVDKEVIEEVNHAQIPSVMIVHNDDNTDHEIEAVNNGQTIETPDALERKHMETNGEMVVCDAMPDLIRSDHDKDVDMSASNKNERKRKFSEMMGEDEECNTNANEKELEILSLSLSLKNEFKKGIHLVGNMRVPSEDNDQNNYINLLTTQLERIQQCNYEMYEYQNKNSRATLGDIIRARNSRGHIRQKQQQ
eukprot:368946_1